MSTILCQNINFPCFEPQLITEITSIPNWECLQIFFQDPTNTTESFKKDDFYTHPLSRKSSISTLSAKSLEMCTENLGNETGTDDVVDGNTSILSSPSLNQENPSNSKGNIDGEKWIRNRVTNEPARNDASAAASSGRRFPPPLTTMSGASSIQVLRRREGGRLIIEAVEAPSRSSALQAERSGGRLRLCYNDLIDSDSDLDTAEAEEEEEAAAVEEGKEEIEFQRLSRCKEQRPGNEVLCSYWKPAFWVATS